MGEGGCQNWPHLNSSGTSLLPRSSLDVAASVQCVEAATGCISSLVASPRGPQSTPSHFSRSSNCMMPITHFDSFQHLFLLIYPPIVYDAILYSSLTARLGIAPSKVSLQNYTQI